MRKVLPSLNRPISHSGDAFAYNERGEVVFSRRAAGNAEDSYCYDGIGNLMHSSLSGVTNAYVANSLNQYATILCVSASPCETIPHYDSDGSMTQFGLWTYAYDSANRLSTVSSNGVLLVANSYDAKGRRVRKDTSNAVTTFFYDGWNLLEERIVRADGTASTVHYYWGRDLSGSLHGAGGVGGLLYLTVDGAIYVPTYDANGNVTRYIDATGATVASYAYDAFGRMVSAIGPLAGFFRHRFSTKYYDSETGLYYYGYRFYHPSLMRWLNRDPIEEDGGLNLYAFCGNNPVAHFDLHGEKIEIHENKLISMDVIHSSARAAFFPSASVSFACSWNGVLSISGRASRRIEILTPDRGIWNVRHRNYNVSYGRDRTNTMEWRAAYSHEMDHWNAFNAFFAFLHLLNEFDGTRLCSQCEEMRGSLERQYNRMWNEAIQHSARYDTKGHNGGGDYPNAR